ncbi:UDP-glucose 4-epimerase GalE [Ancylobacter sp. A5.8]|uniref:UDP-glucose 4-epimerase GalE n=1 Tax=Ancylobacter gelatini TaxID=2919920 RepID=UPI001F4E6F63|nr:UDP-glucose 4-epimerase GalE [Ancylobacter gelatini]MCJ8145237.1 UDP-glucose 4-epimerase GalE [Ancylobacter gelatini]
MAVLVTGGAGYIGSHMVLALLDADFEVVVLDDLSTGFDWLVHPEAALVRGDVADAALVRGIVERYDIEAVVHFAARIVVPESVIDPLGYYHANTAKSRAFLEALIAAGVRQIIFSSTAAVYGMVGCDPVHEDAALAPISPYGRSKLMTEWMLLDAAMAHPLKYVALRYFNVAGADPAGRAGQSTRAATHLIKVAAEAALGKRAGLDIFGTDYPTPDGTCLRDYIHVTDLVAAHLDALRYLRTGGASRVLNCGYGWGYSVREVVDTVKRVSGIDFPVRICPRRVGDPPAIVAGAQCIRSDLGWSPKLADLDVIVAHALSWERQLGERNRM